MQREKNARRKRRRKATRRKRRRGRVFGESDLCDIPGEGGLRVFVIQVDIAYKVRNGV